MITSPTMMGALNDRVVNNVFDLVSSGAPTDGTSGTGVGIAGPGSTYTDYTNAFKYLNTGTKASPVWSKVLNLGSTNFFQQATGTISAANIVATTTGTFGHANGVVLVAPQGAHVVLELISVIFHYDFIVAAYTGGGNITVNNAAGGAAITGLVSAANSVGNAADKSCMLVPLTAAYTPLVENGGLNLVSSAAFTQPGTAAGVIRWVCNYRLHSTGF